MPSSFVKTGYLAYLISKALNSTYSSVVALVRVYPESRLYKAVNLLSLSYHCSFIHKILNSSSKNDLRVDPTRGFFINTCLKHRDVFDGYVRNSAFRRAIYTVKREFMYSPIGYAALILCTIILMNTVLILVFNKELSLWWWFLRGAILFIALFALFYEIRVKRVLQGSLILRWLSRKERV